MRHDVLRARAAPRLAPSIAGFLIGKAQEPLAQHRPRVAALERRFLAWLIPRPEETQMPRQRIERRLLVVQPQARALAVWTGRLDVGDRTGLPFRQLLLGAQRHALGPPIEEVAQIGKGDARIFLDHAVGGDAPLLLTRDAQPLDGGSDSRLAQKTRADGLRLRFRRAAAERGGGRIEIDRVFLQEALLA